MQIWDLTTGENLTTVSSHYSPGYARSREMRASLANPLVSLSYAREPLCLVGDAGAAFPPYTGNGVLRAVANAASLSDALADATSVDDALRRWSEAQLQIADQVIPIAESIERTAVFEMPDLATLPATATNDWMSAAYRGLVVTLPGV